MTNIEEQFYKTFEIEPKDFDENYFIKSVEIGDKRYPKITDKILLELICLWNNYTNCGDELIIPMDFENLKEKVFERFVTPTLYDCAIDDEWLKQQVQQLFKGEE